MRERFEHELCREVLNVSGVTGQGLAQLVFGIVKMIDEVREQERMEELKLPEAGFGRSHSLLAETIPHA